MAADMRCRIWFPCQLPSINDAKNKITNKPMMNQAIPNIFELKSFGTRNPGMMTSSFLQLLRISYPLFIDHAHKV